MGRWLCASLAAGLVLALTTSGWTQTAAPDDRPGQAQNSKAKKSRAAPPQLDETDQLSPQQFDQRWPARREPDTQAEQAAAKQSARAAEGPRTIACSGVFSKDSSHLKLATHYDSRNVAFTEVDGPEGSKLMASVLFPTDPKRRLEVLWQNEASRSDTHLIVINGQSTWSAPKGLRLGMALPALEKLNGKPFKLSGFDQPNGGSVTDWQEGALDKLPGGCRVGVRLVADAKAPEAARNELMGKEFLSSDPKLRAVKPIIAEILIGY